MASGGGTDFAAMVAQKNAENKILIYSKTYCPCTHCRWLVENVP